MKEFMDKLIQWYKDNHYSQGDSYNINYSPESDIWIISHQNDYPLQHGKGGSVVLSIYEIDEIINQSL